MPKELEPGILYVSKEFGVASHLCPCGCRNKIVTPITPPNWSLKVEKKKPTLYPSIGNWQLPCRSHYWIIKGEIKWSYDWTEEQVKQGREKEEKRLKKHYNELELKRRKKLKHNPPVKERKKDNSIPSQVVNVPWLYAMRKKGRYPKANSNSGKWLIFIKFTNVDMVWEKIKTATEKGLLGESAKVSTAAIHPFASKPDLKVICVYTYDYTDKDDVMTIRDELRKLGVINKIPYKTDSATHQNLYEKKGDTRISVYYE